MTKRRLEIRITFTLMVLLLAWFLISSFIVLYEEKKMVTGQKVGEVERLSTILTLVKYNYLSDLIDQAGNKLDKSMWISVYDKGLNWIAGSGKKGIGGGEDLHIASQTNSLVEGFTTSEGGEKIYHVITPLFSGGNKNPVVGLLEVGTSLEGFNGYVLSASRNILVIMILGAGILGSIFYFILRKQVFIPVQRLTDWAGSPDKAIELNGEGELSHLAESLNNMVQLTRERVENLKRSHAELKKEIEKKERALRKMSQDLQEAQFHLVRAGTLSALGEFAAGISHELNNPLGIILGFSQLLLVEVDPGHPYFKSLKRIETESSRCKKIVEDLLNFARPSEPCLEMVQLNEVLDETLQLISYQIPSDIKIIKKYHASLPLVFVDSSQMEQVFINIILNAVQSMPQGGELTVATSVCELTRDECRQLATSFMDYSSTLMGEEGFTGVSRRVLSKKADVYEPGDKAIAIDISDTGCGISRENLVRLFHPFFTTKKTGTGLGLSICWKLVEKQGGIIGVKSIEGEGTTFFIKIPLRKKEDGTDR